MGKIYAFVSYISYLLCKFYHYKDESYTKTNRMKKKIFPLKIIKDDVRNIIIKIKTKFLDF